MNGDRDKPIVQPGKLVLLLLVPIWALLAVVLVSQSARNGTATGQTLRNVVPLHAFSA
jgi:hypothetical protein